MNKRLRHPRRRDEVWLHIDRFGKPSGRVWAVQYFCRRRGKWIYRTATELDGLIRTKFFGERAKQPKAIVALRGALVVGAGARVYLRRSA